MGDRLMMPSLSRVGEVRMCKSLLGVRGRKAGVRQEAEQPHNAMDDVSHFLLNSTLLTFGPDHISKTYCTVTFL